MAIWVFHEFYDPSGEGVRCNLTQFDSMLDAEVAFNRFKQKDDTLQVSVILGDRLLHFDQTTDPLSERTLDDHDLRSSTLEDVDDIDNKENI